MGGPAGLGWAGGEVRLALQPEPGLQPQRPQQLVPGPAVGALVEGVAQRPQGVEQAQLGGGGPPAEGGGEGEVPLAVGGPTK